ncbi:MAG: hypothetical protein GY832_30875 [Chloroflexi bacterium]|nr:hypothetical protein [Chloroflexota bacterium]
MLDNGNFILLYRQLGESDSWAAAPNAKTKVLMIEILIRAAWKTKKVKSGRQMVTLNPGELKASTGDMSGWIGGSPKETRLAVEHLIATGFIEKGKQEGNLKPLVSVCNWGLYQRVPTEKGKQEGEGKQKGKRGASKLTSDSNGVAGGDGSTGASTGANGGQASNLEKACRMAPAHNLQGGAKSSKEGEEVKEVKKTISLPGAEIQSDNSGVEVIDKKQLVKIEGEDVTRVKMTTKEIEKLKKRLGVSLFADYVIRIEEYKHKTGKKYKSDYHTVLSWYRKDQKALPTETSPAQQDELDRLRQKCFDWIDENALDGEKRKETHERCGGEAAYSNLFHAYTQARDRNR